ncbi:MAG: GNAT family N-acetyltransferase [Saprospiraceae bacterium]|nr:GNAT family N-acetyltransferase [Saprospiraceae bacterium]
MNHLDLIQKNFIAKASYFGRFVSNMRVKETPYYICINCGLPSDTFNVMVIKTENVSLVSDFVQPELQYFLERNFPMGLWLWESPSLQVIERQLFECHLVSNETNIGMWLDAHTIQPNLTELPDFEVVLVASPQDLDIYANVLASLFEPSDEAVQIRQYYQLIKPFYQPQDSPMQFFIGKYQDQAVATGTLFFDADSVGIYDIATLETARGKGFGSQMFHFLLEFAKQRGATSAVLQASPDGLGIYKRAGFQEVGLVKVFENRHLLK